MTLDHARVCGAAIAFNFQTHVTEILHIAYSSQIQSSTWEQIEQPARRSQKMVTDVSTHTKSGNTSASVQDIRKGIPQCGECDANDKQHH